jgi:hypothetical protein
LTATIEDAVSQQTVELKVNRVQIDNQARSQYSLLCCVGL